MSFSVAGISEESVSSINTDLPVFVNSCVNVGRLKTFVSRNYSAVTFCAAMCDLHEDTVSDDGTVARSDRAHCCAW